MQTSLVLVIQSTLFRRAPHPQGLDNAERDGLRQHLVGFRKALCADDAERKLQARLPSGQRFGAAAHSRGQNPDWVLILCVASSSTKSVAHPRRFSLLSCCRFRKARRFNKLGAMAHRTG